MKLEALDHPKTLDFASRLNVELPTAIGYLEFLWAFTAKKSPQGNIGKWPDGAIARACHHNGDAALFIKALAESGFLDANPEHRFMIHDWKDHAPRWVLSKLSRAGQNILNCSDDCSADNTVSNTQDYTDNSKASEGKASEGKASQQHNGADAPADMDTKAWIRFVDYRKQIRKPLKPASILAAQRKLAAFGTDQAAVVEQTIANGWQGLFELKDKPRGSSASTQPSRTMQSLRVLEEKKHGRT